jgi:putative iron-only hydrogenase system regulator
MGVLYLYTFFVKRKEVTMTDASDTRVALIGIIVEDRSAVDAINNLLSEYGSYIIGRMGVPYAEKNISIISIILDASNDVISALSGKLGALHGVSTKTIYSRK